MKCLLDKDVLTIYLEGELNSANADAREKEILADVEGKTFTRLVLDFSLLSYISSAGLRVVLKLKQKFGDVVINEASLEVYDVLSMTGFTNIMEVNKALNRISLEGAEVIGSGYFSTVYRINKDTIIKVFNRVSDSKQIERELKLSKEAFVLGIPTAISFDVVKVEDKLGVRFEMLDCESLSQAFARRPDQYNALLDKYVGLLKKINTTECLDPEIPDIKQHFIQKLEKIRPLLEDKYYKKAKGMLEGIPDVDTLVHGDCHFKNIMLQQDELLLIDMDTLSRGHPIFELAAIRAPYVSFEEDDPGNSERFLGMPAEFVSKLYYDVLPKYFGKEDKTIADKIEIVTAIHMLWWNEVNSPEVSARRDGNRKRLVALLDRYDDLNIG